MRILDQGKLVLVALLVIGPRFNTARAQRTQCDSRATTESGDFDLYHPRNFIRIFELTQHGDSVWILNDTLVNGARRIHDAVIGRLSSTADLCLVSPAVGSRATASAPKRIS